MAKTQDPAGIARQVILSSDGAALATILDEPSPKGEGIYPYVSLVLVAFDTDLSALLLISTLAEHTRNLAHSPRASLLFDATQGLADPLTGARVTLMGEAARVDDERLMARYVARHPSAQVYKAFRDFGLWRLASVRAHLVAGFGRIHWLDAAALRPPAAAAAAIAAAEPDILAHMNDDHASTIDLYAGRLLGREGGGWRLTGVDPYGANLRRDAAVARLEFSTLASDAAAVRGEFVRLGRLARGEAGACEG